MISILSSPKPWVGLAAVHQYNAIQSWLALHPDVEVILYGDAPGTATACQRLGVQHVPNIDSTSQGIPYFGAIAEHASNYAKHELLSYVNCDILFTKDMLETFEHVPFAWFLMIGQRIDLAKNAFIDMTKADCLKELECLVVSGKAELHPPAGSDYFVFRKFTWKGLPKVVIGRGGYDNALINYCLKLNIPVIDASLSIKAIHQNHDYNHVQQGEKEIFCGVDAAINRAVIKSKYIPTLLNADWLIKRNQLKKNYCRGDWLQHFWSSRLVKHNDNQPSGAIYFLWRLARKLGLINKAVPSIKELFSKKGK